MNTAPVIVGACTGMAAGAGLWWWLRSGNYRLEADEPRLRLGQSWMTLPATAAAGALAGLVGWSWLAAAWIYLVAGVALTWIDLDVHRLPDRVLRATASLLALALAVAGASTHDWSVLSGAALGSVAVGGMFLLLALVGSMGVGDVKLAAVTGLLLGALGWTSVITGVVAAYMVAAAAGLVLLARGAGKTAHLAFGPAIIAGAALSVVRVGLGW